MPAVPRRPGARGEALRPRARSVAGDVPLLALRDVAPDEVPCWVNAANAVLVPSEREGFGLAVLEALACDVPVLATPVGIAPLALDGIAGTHCGAVRRGALARGAGAPPRRRRSARRGSRARRALLGRSGWPQRVAVAWRRARGRRAAATDEAWAILAAGAASAGNAVSPDR